ncbi:MAG: hypothetical protein Q9168_005969 [Polycauliona sp. 1 TL-2023]
MFSFSRSVYATIVLTTCVLQTVAADPQINWLFPSNGPVQSYSRNDILNASWITSLSLMPTLVSLCQEEATGKGTSNISHYYVHSTGSKMVPLDLWVGNAFPYICKFDFIDADGNRPLNSPSGSFYINDTSNAPSRLWSEKTSIQVSQDNNTTNCTNPTGDPAVPDPDTTHSTHNSGLGGGAIAGAVVGALIGGALIAGLGTFFLLRRKLDRSTPDNTKWLEPGDEGPADTTPMYPKDNHAVVQEKDAGYYAPTPEMGHGQVSELDAARRRSELGSPRS